MGRNGLICKEAKEKIDLAWFAFCNHLVIHLFIYLLVYFYIYLFVNFLLFFFCRFPFFLLTINVLYWGKLKSQVLFFRPFLQIDMLLNLK